MDRSLVNQIVAPFIIQCEQYKVVSLENTEKLLGEQRFQKLLKDPIRNKGPKPNTIYYWNVVDYMLLKETNELPE